MRPAREIRNTAEYSCSFRITRRGHTKGAEGKMGSSGISGCRLRDFRCVEREGSQSVLRRGFVFEFLTLSSGPFVHNVSLFT